MAEFKTKAGYAMNRKLRERIIRVMVERREGTLGAAAAELGIGRRTLCDYLTAEVRAEIEGKRLAGAQVGMDDVDRAMMMQACAGNVAAARLVYMRLAQKGHTGPLPTLEEIENELAKLKNLEKKAMGDE